MTTTSHLERLPGGDANPGERSELDRIFDLQRAAYGRHPMPTAEERIGHLHRLERALINYQDHLAMALNADFGCRSGDETRLAEIFPSVEGIRYAAKRVKKWMKPSRRHVGLLFQPARARVLYQPLGVVGIITPWNYPVYLSIGPLTSALAAGNRVVIKMSKFTPRTAETLKTVLAKTFAEDHVTVLAGASGLGSAFSKKPWDHLFFTGSTQVGRHVMRAAAENLTPVTLELGGKSPAIISPDVPMRDAAERIAFGKVFNAGQTCIAPDYVLCPERRLDDFAAAFMAAVGRMYPAMVNNPQYTSVINDGEYARLAALVADAEKKGARIVKVNPGGESFATSRKMPVHLLLNVTDDMQVMTEEIFGPLLPVVPCDTPAAAVAYVNERPRPLALYYFDYNPDKADYVLTHTHSGGAVINDTLVHVAQDDLPFGGVGDSGMGMYHSHEGFLALSKAKGVLYKPRFNSGKYVYPPYGRFIHGLIYRLFLR
jgi:coniferyl-aldehyde dehydrogenase